MYKINFKNNLLKVVCLSALCFYSIDYASADDQSAENPTTEASAESAPEEVNQAAPDQAASDEAPPGPSAARVKHAAELNSKFATQLSELKKIYDDSRVLHAKIADVYSKLQAIFLAAHPEYHVDSGGDSDTGDDSETVRPEVFKSPELVDLLKQEHALVEQYESKSTQINADVKSAGYPCQLTTTELQCDE